MELPFNTRRRLLGAALSMALAAGCGGGGGGGGGAGPHPSPGALPLASPSPPPEVSSWSAGFSPAAVVLGETGTIPPITPKGTPAITEDGRLFVASGDALLLAFEQYDSLTGPAAVGTYSVLQALGIAIPGGLAAYGTRLVATGNHQVHIFDPAPQSSTDAPVVSIGEAAGGCSASRLQQPQSAFVTPLGQLIVADTFNHRVLIWNTVPDAGTLAEADIVVGQRNMGTCVENDDDGDGTSGAATNGTMYFPKSVWSDGERLLVADTNNHRILVWDTFPSADDPDSLRATHVIGQESFSGASRNRAADTPDANSLYFPASVDVSEAGEMAVADTNNHRVLIWRSIPTDGQAAQFVVGQSNFSHYHANDVEQVGAEGTAPSAKTLSSPSGARFHGRNLIVNDRGNDRVLVWRE